MADDRQNKLPSGISTDPGIGPESSRGSRPSQEDSGELPNAADVQRIIAGVIPKTPERLKERTAATRGQDYARYDAKGAPAKARRADTLEVATPVIADDTNIDGLQLSDNTIAQIAARRSESEERNDTTVSGVQSDSRRRPVAFVLGALALIAVAFLIWHRSEKPTDAPIAPAVASTVEPIAATVAVVAPSTTPTSITTNTSTAPLATTASASAVTSAPTVTTTHVGVATPPSARPHPSASSQATVASTTTTATSASSSRTDLNPNP